MAPQAKRLTSTGIPFNGYLDEVRVWTRPHNPTVVSQNYRVAVTTGTPNLALYWDFNDGKGTVASELMQSQHMEATSRDRPPSWVTTGLELTTSVFAVSMREDAAKTCKALLQTEERLRGCGGLGIATFNIHLQQCIDDEVLAGNPSAADTASSMRSASRCSTGARRRTARSATGDRRATTCVCSARTARATRVTASVNRRTARAGTHLTTFGGLSFEMIQPGVYNYDMCPVADLSVQMLFLPCPHAYKVSLRSNDFTFAVQISDDDQLAVSVLVKSAWVIG